MKGHGPERFWSVMLEADRFIPVAIDFDSGKGSVRVFCEGCVAEFDAHQREGRLHGCYYLGGLGLSPDVSQRLFDYVLCQIGSEFRTVGDYNSYSIEYENIEDLSEDGPSPG